MFKWNNLKKEKILKVQLSGKKKKPKCFSLLVLSRWNMVGNRI